ncbi:hypothetical protein PIB30_028952 [Stylosanthes scabra]|uniref:Uncharacterized protein n=1 Tax=Stylosanthes scabra TaxID=79078 RepID=A0ABU6TAX3_9FABA|nr:hypothetical protein [Stylosanthes scabra]
MKLKTRVGNVSPGISKLMASIITLKSMLDHHLNYKTRKHACGLSQIRAETWMRETKGEKAYPVGACYMDSKRMTRASRSRKQCVNRSSGSKVMAVESWCHHHHHHHHSHSFISLSLRRRRDEMRKCSSCSACSRYKSCFGHGYNLKLSGDAYYELNVSITIVLSDANRVAGALVKDAAK